MDRIIKKVNFFRGVEKCEIIATKFLFNVQLLEVEDLFVTTYRVSLSFLVSMTTLDMLD